MPLVALGAGEMELKPTRSLRLFPCEGATGLGAANRVLDVVLLLDMGSGKPGIEGFAGAVVVGVADWKSSKSSSSAPPDCNDPGPSPSTFEAALFPLGANSFGGVSGGMSSSKPKISISGSFGLGGSAFFGSRFAAAVEVVSGFRRAGEAVTPSSYSSYSSNRSLLLLESWNPDVFPP